MDKEIKFTEKKVDSSWKNEVEKDQQKDLPSDPASIPPFTFTDYITSLGMQIVIHLGLMEHPVTQKKEKNLDAAKEIIDLLVLLKEKTKGNLTPEENSLLTDLIADLQIRFVESAR